MLRNYKENPLGYIQNGSIRSREKPFKEDIIELYIEQNLSVKDCAEYFGLNMRMFQKMLAEYGIKKDRKQVYQLQKKTLLETKGVENVFQLNDIKEKSKQTLKEKYEVEHYALTNEFKSKNLQTRTEKYGDDLYRREKYRQTCLEKYGVENAFQNETVKQKIKETIKNRSGVSFSSQEHLSVKTLEILSNSNNLQEFIVANNIASTIDLALKLGISQSNAYIYVEKYDLFSYLTHVGSSLENEVREYIQQFYQIEHNVRLLDGKEIDIFIPRLNLGIEFNGNYWHNEYKKDVTYHQEKSMIAESKGLFIYHIFEYEWLYNKQKIINQLNNLLGKNQEKIYARKCVIKEVDNKEKGRFLESNHLQGNDSSSIKLGLYFQDELVSLMTFVKPRFNAKYEWELSRFCSKAGCNVIGGASKLFKHFMNKYSPKSIISYSNIAHTKGNLYQMLGFNLSTISSPNYVWYKNGDVKTRYQCQKHKLLEQGFEGDSESEIMHNMGYFRIYDCGNKVWIINNREDS